MSADNENVQIPEFDTRPYREDRHVKIDGVTYTIRPLGAAEYNRLVDRADQIKSLSTSGKITPAARAKAEQEIYDIITPLFTPADEFKKWQASTKKATEFAYRAVMDQLAGIVVPNYRVDQQG